ncbi:MAG TPA: Fic family protein [Acidimicrobiia bacterium]|nr:Fic family protein [Acidimicrobiia bacterium]
MIYETPRLQEIELEAIAKIEERRKSLRFRVAEPRRWYGGLRRLVFAKAVQGSNSIEGYHASLEDVMAAVENEEALDAATETVSALQGYRDAMTYVLQLADDVDFDINEQLVRSLHFMMMKYDLSKRPGRYRLGAIFVQRESDGETVYEGPPAEMVPGLMGELLDCVHAHDGPVLVRAAMAHLSLVMIHPFSDGNGRMGRCLQTLVLARERIVSPVFSSIEEYLGRNTQPYYDILEKVGRGEWHPEHDARAWIRFCLNAHYQCAETMLWRVQEAEELWDVCWNFALTRRLPERVVGPLSDAARGLRIRNASYRVAVEESEGDVIDVPTASRDLRALVGCGLLASHGETRGRYYVRSAELLNAFKKIRAKKPKFENANLFGVEGQQRLSLTDLAN